MKIFLSLVSFSVFYLNVLAQDVIIKKNGDEIISKILQVDSSNIKYKKFDNIDGPLYIIPKSDVFIIKYENGTKDVINKMDVPETPNKNDEMINKKRMFKEGLYFISFGYGFGTFLNNMNSSYDYQELNTTLTGPMYGKLEYAASEDFGIGVTFAYVKYVFSYYYDAYDSNTGTYKKYFETDTYTSFSGMLRANWHFGNSEKVDPYFGFGLGFRSATLKYTNNDPSGYPHYEYTFYDNNWLWGGGENAFPIGFESTFGVRFKITEHFGAYAEAGIAKSAIQFGLMAKF